MTGTHDRMLAASRAVGKIHCLCDQGDLPPGAEPRDVSRSLAEAIIDSHRDSLVDLIRSVPSIYAALAYYRQRHSV